MEHPGLKNSSPKGSQLLAIPALGIQCLLLSSKYQRCTWCINIYIEKVRHSSPNLCAYEENKQNLIVERCYIPFTWKEEFAEEYLNDIHYYCLLMSRNYIEQHFSDIKEHANEIEQRLDDTGCTITSVLAENAHYSELCQKYGCNYLLIDDCYQVDIDL